LHVEDDNYKIKINNKSKAAAASNPELSYLGEKI
jgi:hypothetical protein